MTAMTTVNEEKKGRILINTGDGKGKTTAALGTAFRALGHGHRVCVVQFVKGPGDVGERLQAAQLERFDWFVCGCGFVRHGKKEIHEKAAQEGFALAQQKVTSDVYDLIILDEITYLPRYGFVSVEDIVALVESKPRRLSIILTGRGAHKDLLAIADTVTEMRAVKHAYELGVTAQPGIEF